MNNNDSQRSQSGYTLPPADERRAALEEQFRDWVPGTLSQHLDAMVERCANKPLVILDDRHLTYRDIADWSRRLATGLVSLGIGRGDNVALIMANYPEFVALKFAIARIGAVAVPINFLLRREELKYILRQSDTRALVTMCSCGDRDYLADLDALMPDWAGNGGGAEFPLLKHVIAFPGEGTTPVDAMTVAKLGNLGGPDDERQLEKLETLSSANDNADVVYTSGTTGSPKGVMLEHHMVLRAAYASAYTCAFE